MATWLKQSTSVDVPIGPFLDETDGKTAETALTITQPDVRLKKNSANWAQKAAAQTLTHEENGWYEVTLDATDTNTLGVLVVAVHESGALPCWREFLVVAANVYDSIVGGGDVLDVSMIQNLGIAVPALVNSRHDVSVGAIEAGVLTELGGLMYTTIATLASQTSFTLSTGSADNNAYVGAMVVVRDSVTTTQKAVGVCSAYVGATKTVTLLTDPGVFVMAVGDWVAIIASNSRLATIQADTDDIQTRLPAALVGGRMDSAMQAVDGTAQGGDATHIQLAAGASAVDDFYNGLVIYIVGGTGMGQFRMIDDYVGSTKQALVATWLTNPNSTSLYVIR